MVLEVLMLKCLPSCDSFAIFCQQKEIGELNTVRIYDAAVMIINRNPFDLQREGPNQQAQDLGQLLPDPGMKASDIYDKHKL